jgi:hypothetical protein
MDGPAGLLAKIGAVSLRWSAEPQVELWYIRTMLFRSGMMGRLAQACLSPSVREYRGNHAPASQWCIGLSGGFASRIQRPVQEAVEGALHGSKVVARIIFEEAFRMSAVTSVSRNSIVRHRNASFRRSRCRRIRSAAAEGFGSFRSSLVSLMVAASSCASLPINTLRPSALGAQRNCVSGHGRYG